MFGYTPEDFKIYKQLNKIDMSGVKKTMNMPLGYDSDSNDEIKN